MAAIPVDIKTMVAGSGTVAGGPGGPGVPGGPGGQAFFFGALVPSASPVNPRVTNPAL